MRKETFLLPILRFLNERPRLMNAVLSRDSWGNPYTDEVLADPDIFIERMWRDGPATYKRNYQRWMVSGYEECQQLANHPDARASDTVNALFAEVRPYSKLSAETKQFFQNWMLINDGTDHRRLRQLVSRTFTPQRVTAFEPQVRTIADDLLARVAELDKIDMVADFNLHLPLNVLTGLLGIPRERTQWAGERVAAAATLLDPLNTFSVEAIDQAVAELSSYVLELAEERRRRPEDDLITALVQAEEANDRLTEDELLANVGLLVFAGHETTANMLGLAARTLAHHPDQHALVRANPDLWPNAVEELLRYDTSVVALNRDVSADIDLGSAVLRKGSVVTLQLNAANRDPRRWDDPYQLRLDREDPRPVSFGHGLHHCLGHALARTELRVGLEAFSREFGLFTVDDEATEWRSSATFRGPSKLMVTRGSPNN